MQQKDNRLSRIFRKSRNFIIDLPLLLTPQKIFISAYIQRDGKIILPNNWGDDINILFLESITDVRIIPINGSPLFDNLPLRNYSCIGSILGNFTNSHSIVWGSGLISEDTLVREKPKQICSVRGPLTQQLLIRQGISCPQVYGDPALLVSRYYYPSIEVRYELGIIPHYIDEDNAFLLEFCERHPEVKLIKMKGYKHWHDIPDQVLSCKRIISSSLHGLIVADSYSIPNVWIQLSDRIVGGDFKFLDYFASVGRKTIHAYHINSTNDFEKILTDGTFTVAPSINYESIVDACPFKQHLMPFSNSS